MGVVVIWDWGRGVGVWMRTQYLVGQSPRVRMKSEHLGTAMCSNLLWLHIPARLVPWTLLEPKKSESEIRLRHFLVRIEVACEGKVEENVTWRPTFIGLDIDEIFAGNSWYCPESLLNIPMGFQVSPEKQPLATKKPQHLNLPPSHASIQTNQPTFQTLTNNKLSPNHKPPMLKNLFPHTSSDPSP
jgi:hypothetical protein